MPVNLIKPKLYYELHNFYGSHSKFVKSRSYKQLRGDEAGTDEIDQCAPITSLSDLDNHSDMYEHLNSDYSDSDIANPCGLIAKYHFNDTFSILESSTRKTVKIDETNIAYSVDKTYKFVSLDESGQQWTNVQDEHLMVWYQMQTFPTFIKLWGHINTQLEQGKTYTFIVKNNYDVDYFNGQKYIYLSEMNDYGGTNKFMGIAFLLMSAVCAVIMIVFMGMYYYRIKGNESFYDPDFLEW